VGCGPEFDFRDGLLRRFVKTMPQSVNDPDHANFTRCAENHVHQNIALNLQISRFLGIRRLWFVQDFHWGRRRRGYTSGRRRRRRARRRIAKATIANNPSLSGAAAGSRFGVPEASTDYGSAMSVRRLYAGGAREPALPDRNRAAAPTRSVVGSGRKVKLADSRESRRRIARLGGPDAIRVAESADPDVLTA